jgi:hypothetical protein
LKSLRNLRGSSGVKNKKERSKHFSLVTSPMDPLEVLVGSAKRFKEAFNGLFQDMLANMDFKRIYLFLHMHTS